MDEFEGFHPQVTESEERVVPTDLEQELAACRQDRDRFLRQLADADNARKRSESAASENLKVARKRWLIAFLPIADNLDRALCGPTGDPQALRRGIEMVRRQVSDILAQQGVARVASAGEAFDPRRHEAVETAPGESGRVLREVEPGYTIEGQLLRPARVVVGRGEEGPAEPCGKPVEPPQAVSEPVEGP